MCVSDVQPREQLANPDIKSKDEMLEPGASICILPGTCREVEAT